MGRYRWTVSGRHGDWPTILPQIKDGDFVLLVFGINDGTTPPGLGDETIMRYEQPVHTYGWYMSKMATDAVNKGAHVILLTVTTRNIWKNPSVKFADATRSDRYLLNTTQSKTRSNEARPMANSRNGQKMLVRSCTCRCSI